MNLAWSSFLVVVSAGAAMAALLLVRRRSPHGGHFDDTGRAAGVFSILATSFAVLFAFVVFLAYGSYDRSSASAESEAQAVTQQFETAQLLPAEAGPELSAELRCYAISVIEQEWPEMAKGDVPALNPWGVRLFLTLQRVDPATPTEQAAYAQWLDQSSAREQARAERTLGEDGVIPTPLWFVLLISAGIVLAFVFLFADRGEGAVVQAILVGSVTAMLVAGLLVIRFLDFPFHPGSGSLRPVAMEESLVQIDQASELLGLDLPDLCDSDGVARAPLGSAEG